MGIKRKKSGAVPMFDERWKELAKDPQRLNEAAREYRLRHPEVRLVEAHRAVQAFSREFQKTWSRA